jgi:hypothetical protein
MIKYVAIVLCFVVGDKVAALRSFIVTGSSRSQLVRTEAQTDRPLGDSIARVNTNSPIHPICHESDNIVKGAAFKLFLTSASFISTNVLLSAEAANADSITGTVSGRALFSDEIPVQVAQQYLGLGLVEVNYGSDVRVTVQSVKPDAEAAVQEKVRSGEQ